MSLEYNPASEPLHISVNPKRSTLILPLRQADKAEETTDKFN